MADFHGLKGKRSGGGNSSRRRSIMGRDEELQEGEVWELVKGDDFSPHTRKHRYFSSPRMIPGSNRHSTRGRGDESDMVIRQSSAPMNIPDWSKIYGRGNGSWVEGGDGHVHVGDGGGDDDDGNYDGEMVPPHQWLARKLARSQISSFSMCEGIGRTLKGRDLSKVRNAVLAKTGFLE